MLYNKEKTLLIAANPSAEKDIRLTLDLPLAAAGLNGSRYRISDLWGNGKTVTVSRSYLEHFTISIPADHHAGGGLAIYKIESLENSAR